MLSVLTLRDAGAIRLLLRVRTRCFMTSSWGAVRRTASRRMRC